MYTIYYISVTVLFKPTRICDIAGLPHLALILSLTVSDIKKKTTSTTLRYHSYDKPTVTVNVSLLVCILN